MATDALFGFSGLTEDINDMIAALNRMDAKCGVSEREAMEEAAKIVADEQRRIVAETSPKLAGLIKVKIVQDKTRTKAVVGYDSDDIKAHPEILVIEFGKPGLSKTTIRRRKVNGVNRRLHRYSPNPREFYAFDNAHKMHFFNLDPLTTDVLGRKIGKVDAKSHIRAAWFKRRDEALKIFLEKMLGMASEEWSK